LKRSRNLRSISIEFGFPILISRIKLLEILRVTREISWTANVKFLAACARIKKPRVLNFVQPTMRIVKRSAKNIFC